MVDRANLDHDNRAPVVTDAVVLVLAMVVVVAIRDLSDARIVGEIIMWRLIADSPKLHSRNAHASIVIRSAIMPVRAPSRRRRSLWLRTEAISFALRTGPDHKLCACYNMS